MKIADFLKAYEGLHGNANIFADKVSAQLPNLEGSEKQIAWAEKIRNKKLFDIYNLAETCPKNEGFVKWNVVELSLQILEDTINNASASFWIDNRDRNWYYDIKEFYAEVSNAMQQKGAKK